MYENAYLMNVDWTQKLIIILNERRMNRRQFAELAGLDYSYLAKSLKRKSDIGSSIGRQIADALGVTSNWLFNDSKGMDEVEYLDRPSNQGDMRRRRVKSAVDFFNDDSPELQHAYEIVVQLLHDRVAEEKRVIDTKPHPMRRKTDKPHPAGSAI